MKNKHNGWSARRRYKRESDRIARGLGYADHRSMCHVLNVEELRGILKDLMNLMFFPDAPAPKNADGKLFDTRAVAEAIGATPKVIRHLVFTHQLEPEAPRVEKARKLFFRASAIAKFLWSRRIWPGSKALKSTVVANPRSVGGVGLTKEEAAKSLELSTRAVDRYLARGLLRKTAVSSKRMTLVSSKSVNALAVRLVDQEDRAGALALKHLDRASKKIAFKKVAVPGH